MEGGEAKLEGQSDVAVPQIQQAKHQESREVTQTDLENQESGAGAYEVCYLIEESPQVLPHAQSVTTSEPASPKRHKNIRWREEGRDPGIEAILG
jgi:hypothetical protein